MRTPPFCPPGPPFPCPPCCSVHHGYEHRTLNGQAESKSYGFLIVEPTEEARDAKAIDEAGAEVENAIAVPEEVAPIEELVLLEKLH